MSGEDLGSYAVKSGQLIYENDKDTWEADKFPPVSCEIQFEMLKMFVEQFEISEDPNCSAAICLRRILDQKCPRGICRHEPDSLALFGWIFELLEEELYSNGAISFQEWLEQAIHHQDINTIDHLSKSFCQEKVVLIINSSILSISAFETRASDQTRLLQYAMNHSVNLHCHLVAEPMASHICYCNRPPTTITVKALQSSAGFFRFRTTLQRLGIDITSFVLKEIEEGPAVTAGWSVNSLQTIFDLDYTPVEYPLYFICLGDCWNMDTQMGLEISWYIMLDKLKTRDAFIGSVEDILREREEEVVKFKGIDGRICPRCGKVGAYYATEFKRDVFLSQMHHDRKAAMDAQAGEDSMFLLSL